MRFARGPRCLLRLRSGRLPVTRIAKASDSLWTEVPLKRRAYVLSEAEGRAYRQGFSDAITAALNAIGIAEQPGDDESVKRMREVVLRRVVALKP